MTQVKFSCHSRKHILLSFTKLFSTGLNYKKYSLTFAECFYILQGVIISDNSEHSSNKLIPTVDVHMGHFLRRNLSLAVMQLTQADLTS